MKKERSNLKKLILILLGISLLLGGTIFIIYKNNQNSKEEVIDIFKEDKKEEKEESKDNIPTTKVTVDIKGMINYPGVYEVDSNSRVNDQTCTIMIQKLNLLFARNPLISKGI